MERLRIFLWIAGLYLGIAGTITFTLFIHEEAIQTAIWGTWPASDAKDWKTVRTGMQIIRKINFSMRVINYGVGWIQPLAFVSYYQYARATDYYLDGLTAKVLANAPELYVDEEITFNFRPRSVAKNKDGTFSAHNRKIEVVSNTAITPGIFIRVTGTLKQTSKGQLVLVTGQ